MKILMNLSAVILLLGYGTTICIAQSGDAEKNKSYEKAYASLSSKVSADRIKKGVYYISQDPLPRRVMNDTLPGHKLSMLEEADAYIMNQLSKYGYKPVTDNTQVRAFGRDRTKPPSAQYARPADNAPWYTAHNIIADKKGTVSPDQLIIIIAHKDSQSWIPSPGANDNGVGTCGAMELAMVLQKYKPNHTIRFIWCNEEHTPWTSVTAARNLKDANANVLAVINMDGIGVKGPGQAGHMTNVTRYTSDEGEKLADMMDALNKRHAIGLEQSKFRSTRPGDDDGSFINAGFPWTVLNIGSLPYADPNYHQEADSAEKVDFENAKLTTQLTLAAVLYMDMFGRP